MKRFHRLQEEVKKLEEQESAVNVACPTEDEASWVITCEGDYEEEITPFDCETVKKTINEISTFLSTVDNLKISPEGFDSEVIRTRVMRTDEIPNALLSCRASSADSERNWRCDRVDSRGTYSRVHR